MELKILYRGCVKSGNIGDDILIDIFCQMICNVLVQEFDITIIQNNKINNYYDNEEIIFNDMDIFVIGGGSIIHPNETSYTAFNNNYEKILFINGTGITDCNKITTKFNNDLFDINFFKNNIFVDENIKINFERINSFYKNNNVFGGFRGIFETIMYNSFYKNDKISYINDIGFLSNIIKIKKTEKINNYGRKIVLINPILIGGNDCLKEQIYNYDEYNNYIDECLIMLSVYLVQNNYFVFIADFTNDLNKYLYDNIVQKLSLCNQKYVDYLKNNTIENALNVIKQCYLIIGTRLHTSIIGNSFLIPSVTIAYGIKHINYLLTNKLEDYALTTYRNSLSLNNLITKFNKIINNYDDIKEKLKIINKTVYYNYYNEIVKILKKKIKKNDYTQTKYNCKKYNDYAIIFFSFE